MYKKNRIDALGLIFPHVVRHTNVIAGDMIRIVAVGHAGVPLGGAVTVAAVVISGGIIDFWVA